MHGHAVLNPFFFSLKDFQGREALFLQSPLCRDVDVGTFLMELKAGQKILDLVTPYIMDCKCNICIAIRAPLRCLAHHYDCYLPNNGDAFVVIL